MDEPEHTNGIPRLFYIEEIAEEWRVDTQWLAIRLRDGRLEGVKVGRRWAMTEAQMAAALDSMSNRQQVQKREAVESPDQYGGLTRRSWLYRQRYGAEGNPNIQGPRRKST
jgi:hypothetical protein